VSERSTTKRPVAPVAVDASPDFEYIVSVALAHVPELRRNLAAIVEAVARHDRAHRTQLLETLRMYCDCDRSVSAAAGRLGVHRHTVINRIAQAEALLGRSLRKGKDRYILDVALIAAARAERL
jgi:DNA-binding PucR family transcriptional regulator